MSYKMISKKKLLFVISSLVGGGAEKVVVNLVNHLNKDKYDILLVLFENILDYQKDLGTSIKIICLDKKSRWDFFKLIFKLRKIIYRYKPAVVMSFLYYTNIVTAMATLFLKRRFKLILSERNYHCKYLSKTRLGVLKRWLVKLAYKKADRIVTVSKGIKSALEEDLNIQPDKIRTIYNPIALETIRERAQKEAEHPFFKVKDAQVIISVGRLVEQKRFDRLLKVFSLIKDKQKKVYLIILGKGELQEELKDLASQLSINKRIDFVGFKSNPYAWISKADIFVLASDWEGFPNAALEAMACGTSVILTNCPSGPGEIITNGKDGILVPPADEKAFAEAVLTFLRDRNLRKRFAEEGRKRTEDFRLEKILTQYKELF